MKLYRASAEGETADNEGQHVLPNIMEITQGFEDNSVGVGREESFRIFLSIKHLVENHPLKSVRFWGKKGKGSYIELAK